MKNSDFIIKWVDKLKTEMNELPFVEDDIRMDFFGMINDIAYCYYRPYLLYEISNLTNDNKLDFGSLKDNKHIKAIEALSKNSVSKKSHFNSLNRNLILDAWSTFEISVNTFCQGVCDEGEIDKLLSHKFSDLKKIIPRDKLTESELSEIKPKLKTKHLTHVPIIRKTDALFKKAKGYSRNIEDDKKFLSFFGRLRNTMHSNFIYYGNSFEYDFGNAKFKFDNEEIVKWYDPFEPTPKLYFYLVGNLKDIWKALISSIKFDGMIYYPNLA
ncbi:hypothetical protein [Cellulophaga lytica]|uniref:hypothetical protein n=1 Tax=Cellulophaga lytica TaxID=979 RepID=UPI003CE59FCE